MMTDLEFDKRLDIFALGLLVGLVLGVLFASYAFGQAATEVFIPIGQSPGLSETDKTILGLIEARHGRTLRLIQVAPEPARKRKVTLKRSTIIYLDRSKIQRPNTVGSLKDLEPHRLVEVYQDKWVKVRVE